jgi:hypothetical protein
VLELLNELWRALDHALTGAEALEPVQRGVLVLDKVAVVVTVAGTIHSLPLDILKALCINLPPLRRRGTAKIIDMLSIIQENIDAILREQDRDQLPNRMNVTRINLSHLHRHVVAFDADLAAICAGRQLRNVDHRNTAAHIRPFVDQNIERA